MRFVTSIAACAALASGVPAMAQAQSESSFLCGGVSEEHRAEQEQFAHTLKVVYAQPDGHYLADVHTQVTDASGTVLIETVCEGPWLLANLPGGQYEITSSYQREVKTTSVSVDGETEQEQLVTF